MEKSRKQKDWKENRQEEAEYVDQIEGRNSVLELLNSDRDINKILIAKGEKHGSINKIIAIAKEKKILISEIEKAKFNQIAKEPNNQGSLPLYHHFPIVKSMIF